MTHPARTRTGTSTRTATTTSHDATAPPPQRDQVRLLVQRPNHATDTMFNRIGEHLEPGDLLVVNTSRTLPAAVDATRSDGSRAVLHAATRLDQGDWVVEVRPPGRATGPVDDLQPGEVLTLPDTSHLTILSTLPGQQRLHRARTTGDLTTTLVQHGRPIAYAYVPDRHPLAAYQTVFASEPGSAEMPSAGRPFTAQGVTDLITRGVLVAPILLHTGVSSPESGEPPLPERFRVPAATAALVEHVRREGGRVVAVGTTVTRALETVAGRDGTLRAGEGWTDLVLSPDRPARVVTGLLTGWHAPGASHLLLLQAVAGESLVRQAYERAEDYLWHEFGDSCLLLP